MYLKKEKIEKIEDIYPLTIVTMRYGGKIVIFNSESDNIKNKLEQPDLVNYIVEDRCLFDDLFDGDNSFRFVRTYWQFGLFFVFENNDGGEKEYRMSADFVWVA